MPGPKEIPELVTELVDMSTAYLRQEVVQPARHLGRFAGLGIAAGAVFALAALFLVLGAFALLVAVLPEGPWWTVLARGLTVVVAGGVAGLIAWRMLR